jgi:plastocyanin
VRSTQPPVRTIADGTGQDLLTESPPASIAINLRAQEGAFYPSSITVPAGAEVTIVFDNGDVDIRHSVVIYADRTAPIFKGTAIKGPSTITYTFTAPSTPGEYVLGCGVPTPHRKGDFIVT